MLNELSRRLAAIPSLGEMASRYLAPREGEAPAAMEFILEALHQHSFLSRGELIDGAVYRDVFEEMARSLNS